MIWDKQLKKDCPALAARGRETAVAGQSKGDD
jgi:hypothetical protein